jgi:hypothetical protein
MAGAKALRTSGFVDGSPDAKAAVRAVQPETVRIESATTTAGVTQRRDREAARDDARGMGWRSGTPAGARE